jgi:hypothetical protein
MLHQCNINCNIAARHVASNVAALQHWMQHRAGQNGMREHLPYLLAFPFLYERMGLQYRKGENLILKTAVKIR